MQRVRGGKALSETGRGRIRAAVDLSQWVSMRRRQTGGGDLAAGSYRVSSPRRLRKNPPQPPNNLTAQPYTRARGGAPFNLNNTRWPGLGPCLSTSSSALGARKAHEIYHNFRIIREPSRSRRIPSTGVTLVRLAGCPYFPPSTSLRPYPRARFTAIFELFASRRATNIPIASKGSHSYLQKAYREGSIPWIDLHLK